MSTSTMKGRGIRLALMHDGATAIGHVVGIIQTTQALEVEIVASKLETEYAFIRQPYALDVSPAAIRKPEKDWQQPKRHHKYKQRRR